jgi:hypothetical protein
VPVPVGQVPPNVAEYLEELERRIGLLETPESPVIVPAYTTAARPAASAFPNGVYRDTTINILGVSDGTNWKRQDTGGTF